MKKQLTEDTRLSIEIIEDARDVAVQNIDEAVICIKSIIKQAKLKFKDPVDDIAGNVSIWEDNIDYLRRAKRDIKETSKDLINDFRHPCGAEVKYE